MRCRADEGNRFHRKSGSWKSVVGQERIKRDLIQTRKLGYTCKGGRDGKFTWSAIEIKRKRVEFLRKLTSKVSLGVVGGIGLRVRRE